jgi:hypothetical protein
MSDEGLEPGEALLVGEVVEDGDGGAPPGGEDAARRAAGPGPGGGPAGVTFAATVGHGRRTGHGGLAFGAVLVTVGAAVLAGRVNDVAAAGGAALWIGLGCLVWWLFNGGAGLLVPGAVLTGLATGRMLEEAFQTGQAATIALGAGFVAITLLDALRHGRFRVWWPLVPGAVLIAVGLVQDTTGWGSALGDLGWPLLLIVSGLLLVGVALARRRPRA